jgi:hypothetical protein
VVALMTMVVLLVPWTAYNATRFERPVVLSTGFGPLVWSSNCHSTYSGSGLGGWGFVCGRTPTHRATDESVADGQLRDIGLRYVSRHVDRLPVVIGARLARSFGLWHPATQVRRDLFLDEANLGWLGSSVALEFAGSVVIATVGLLHLRRRGRSVLPLLAPVVTVIIVTVVGYGSVRFRVGLDAVLPIMVGVGYIATWDRWRGRTDRESGNLHRTSR